jgi:hypothetical protein
MSSGIFYPKNKIGVLGIACFEYFEVILLISCFI